MKKRSKFVLKYFECLVILTNGMIDTVVKRQIMKRHFDP